MRISTSYAITTPESAKEGDYAETGWRDEEGREFDDVDEAIAWLRREGASEASSSSFGSRIWYSSQPIENYRTGADTIYSFHLHGFSEYEQRKVFNAITGRTNPRRTRRRRATRRNPAGAADPRTGVYAQSFKLRGYSGRPTILTVHSLSSAKAILRRLFPTATKQDHARLAAQHEQAAARYEKLWGRAVEKAHRETFGTKWSGFDYKVSGVGRSEYAERHKKILRMAAQRGSAHSTIAHYHRALAGRARS